MVEYVYHPLICFVSQYNLVLLRQFTDPGYSRLALARAPTWGHLVTFNLNEDLRSQEVGEVALRRVRAASVAGSGYAYKFLVPGAMLRPLELRSGSVTVGLAGKPVGRVSAIQHSVRRAADGAIGVILMPRSPIAVLVTNGLSFHPHIAGGAWISVLGSGLARRTPEWMADDVWGIESCHTLGRDGIAGSLPTQRRSTRKEFNRSQRTRRLGNNLRPQRRHPSPPPPQPRLITMP